MDLYRLSYITDQILKISEITFWNRMKVKDGYSKNERLVQNCSSIMQLKDENNQNRKENGLLIANLKFQAYSMFDPENPILSNITLKVYAEN